MRQDDPAHSRTTRRAVAVGAAAGAAAAACYQVVNSYGQTHEVANLYVAGCGIFPTESSANPTFTLNALSLRGAEQLVTNWNSIAS